MRSSAILFCIALPFFAAAPGAAAMDGHEFDASFKLSSLDYREDFPPPGKSEESGVLPGMDIRYTYLGAGFPLYARVAGELTAGKSTYDGAIDERGTIIPYTDNSTHLFTRAEVQLGYAVLYQEGRRPEIILFVGFGYRSWIRQLPGTGGYEEDYSWTYLPAGVRFVAPVGERWEISVEGTARMMLSGSIAIKLAQFNNPTLTLGNRFGWILAVPVGYRLSKTWSLIARAWYEYSAIGESNNSTPVNLQGAWQYVKEPSSNTRMGGVDLGIRFHF